MHQTSADHSLNANSLAGAGAPSETSYTNLGPDSTCSSMATSRSQRFSMRVCHSSSVTSHSMPFDAKVSASQAVVSSRDSPSRSSLPNRHLKGFPLGYVSSRPQLHTLAQSRYQAVPVTYGSSVAQAVNPLQMSISGLQYPGQSGLVGQQMLINQAGQLISPSCLQMMSAAYTHPTLAVSQPQYALARNPNPLMGLQMPTSQPLVHLPRTQSYQAALRQQQSLVRPQYVPVAHMPPSLPGLAVSAARSAISPAQYMMVSPQMPVAYPQMMYSPQVVSQSQMLGSPLQLSATGLGLQTLPRMSSVNSLGMPLVLTQPPQPRMRYS